MNVLSLFAGIGGLDLGLEWAGFRTIAFVERDPACQHWLAQHWPGIPIHGDIHTFSGVPLRGLVDLVCGGFPCQPFSVAGKQKGTEDERHLWPEMSRIIREVRPRWVLAENVPGLRTIAADLVLEDLEGQGYTCWPLVVGVDDVGGPHRRKRVWIVAYRNSDGLGRFHGEAGQGPDGTQQRAHTDREGGQSFMAYAYRDGGGADGWTSGEAGHPDVSEPPVGEPTGGPGLEGGARNGGAARSATSRSDRDSGTVGPGAELGDSNLPRPTRFSGVSGAPKASEERLWAATPRSGWNPRWPSRPGEPQHEWEAPRLAYTERQRRGGRSLETSAGNGTEPGRDGMADSSSEPPRSPGQPRQDPDPREPESPMGGAAPGLSDGLAGLSSAHRREALKALGNAVSPPCSYYIGRAIMNVEQERVA